MALQYITTQEYEDYIGETAPSNIERLEYLAVALFKKVLPQNFPEPDELTDLPLDCEEKVKNAISEQINFFDDNQETVNGSFSTTGGFSLGKLKVDQTAKDSTNQYNRVSPNALMLLADCGYTYQGVGSLGVCYGN